MTASWGRAAMLRRRETSSSPSTRGDVCREEDTVSSLSEISASWTLYLQTDDQHLTSVMEGLSGADRQETGDMITLDSNESNPVPVITDWTMSK